MDKEKRCEECKKREYNLIYLGKKVCDDCFMKLSDERLKGIKPKSIMEMEIEGLLEELSRQYDVSKIKPLVDKMEDDEKKLRFLYDLRDGKIGG